MKISAIFNTKFIFLIMLIFLPSFGYVALNLSSLTFGVFTSLLLLWTFSSNTLVNLKLSKKSQALFLLFFIHIVMSFFLSNMDFTKTVPSLILLVFIILSALLFSQKLEKIDNLSFINVLHSCSKLILFFAVFSLFLGNNFLGYDNFPKSIFPFAEPRHFVTSSGSLLLFSAFYASPKNKTILSLLFPIFIFVFESVVFLAFYMIIFYFLYLLNIKKSFQATFLAIIFFMTTLYLFADLSYFSERLNFSSSNLNLTALVYMQGWNEIFYSLKETNGFGVGFQNMGILKPTIISEVIYELAGFYKNRNDGSFLASKIISEFGFIGVLFVLLYLKQFYSSFTELKKYLKNKNSLNFKNQISPIFIFAHTHVVFFIIEMFAAGTGYFTTGVFLFIVSLIILKNDSHKKIQEYYE